LVMHPDPHTAVSCTTSHVNGYPGLGVVRN
jgi:hypothetical protein